MPKNEKMQFSEIEKNVVNWANQKGINNPDKQLQKVMEEVGELAGAHLKGSSPQIKNELGDVLVTLCIYANQMNIQPEAAFEMAWYKIKDRQGKTINGTFIKSEK